MDIPSYKPPFIVDVPGCKPLFYSGLSNIIPLSLHFIVGDRKFYKTFMKNNQTSSMKFSRYSYVNHGGKTMVRSPASTKIPGAPGSSWRPPRGLPPPPAAPPPGRAAPSGLGPEKWRVHLGNGGNPRKHQENVGTTTRNWEKMRKKKKNLETIGTWDIDRNPAKLFNVHQTRSKIRWSNHVETLTTQISEKKNVDHEIIQQCLITKIHQDLVLS